MAIFTDMKAYLNQDYHQFFMDLAANNHKDWFDANRKRYEKDVKNPFNELVAAVIDSFAQIDTEFKGLEPKDCIFRINRDIRFSKDKTPYKTYCSAVIAKGGRKTRSLDGVYLECSPEHTRIYGGIYELDSPSLLEVRRGIANNLKEFQELYSDKKFVQTFGQLRGEKNKVLPKELQEAATKEELLFNKQWYFFNETAPETATHDDFLKRITHCYQIARPLEHFFQKFLN